MIVTLHPRQRVSAGSRIRFQHLTDSRRIVEVILNERQFQNLNDLINNLDKYQSLKYFPLGSGLYIYRCGRIKKIIDYCSHTFFWFYEKAWHYYVDHVHDTLYSSLRFEKAHCHQSDAQHESRPKHRSRRNSSNLQRRHKTLSRSPRNACHENEKRSKHTNVSRRSGTDSRLRSRLGSRKHASRIHRKVKADQHDARMSSDETLSIESCDQCSVEEDSLSSEDRLD